MNEALYTDLCYVDPHDTNILVATGNREDIIESPLNMRMDASHPTLFLKREVYEKYGYFNIELKSAADYELMLRFLYKERIKPVYLPKIIVKMRQGGMSNQSLKKQNKSK